MVEGEGVGREWKTGMGAGKRGTTARKVAAKREGRRGPKEQREERSVQAFAGLERSGVVGGVSGGRQQGLRAAAAAAAGWATVAAGWATAAAG